MTNELDRQKRLVARIKDEGGYGYVANNAYRKGVPDLVLVHPEFGMATIEVKHEKNWGLNTSRRVKVTKIQASTLRKTKNAGGNAGVIVWMTNGHIWKLAWLDPPRPEETANLRRVDFEEPTGFNMKKPSEKLATWIGLKLKGESRG